MRSEGELADSLPVWNIQMQMAFYSFSFSIDYVKSYFRAMILCLENLI